ncbi:MAG: Outer membrane protein assembly factor BamE [Glaciecola sp. HTCC2999]|nr:MAG: Outer membrane protein assembly factor BamE [Glaciecola sp. HTCC2999]
MKLSPLILCLVAMISLSGCSNWIFRIDIPQGNYLDDRDVKKLRIEMTKEQVEFVLGRPIVKDSFDPDTWYYVYEMKRGMTTRGEDFRKELVIKFTDNKLSSAEGDFELDPDFNTPLG